MELSTFHMLPRLLILLLFFFATASDPRLPTAVCITQPNNYTRYFNRSSIPVLFSEAKVADFVSYRHCADFDIPSVTGYLP